MSLFFSVVKLVVDKVSWLMADRLASLEWGQSLDKVASVVARGLGSHHGGFSFLFGLVSLSS